MSSVVIAEDNPELRALYSRTLTRRGYSVIPCPDGTSAFTQVRDRRPDLVLTDVDMPAGMTGLELVAALRADPTVADIPVIVVTGGSATITAADAPGVVGLLRKPVSPGELVGHVRAALAGAH
ncbi:response regulator [Planosporangium sp. 12N6]|uniref:response regulator n=1 Tax=Planosporangium spinosum TaxID=3402278 RepID=UPI003CEEDD40